MKQLFGCEANQLAPAVELLQRFWEDEGLAADAGFMFEVCLEELFFNVVRYNTKASQISVELGIVDALVTLIIEDDGFSFDPFSRDAVNIDASVEDREIGGLGIHLVTEMMETCGHVYRDGKNISTVSLTLG